MFVFRGTDDCSKMVLSFSRDFIAVSLKTDSACCLAFSLIINHNFEASQQNPYLGPTVQSVFHQFFNRIISPAAVMNELMNE